MHQDTTGVKSEKKNQILGGFVNSTVVMTLKMVVVSTPREVDCVGLNLLWDRLLRKYW